MLGVSRSSYYSWLKSKPAMRKLENHRLTGLICQLNQENKQSASPCIAKGLRQQSIHMSRPLVAALKMALQHRPVSQPLIFHSDRGEHYACKAFRKELKGPIRQSISRQANCSR